MPSDRDQSSAFNFKHAIKDSAHQTGPQCSEANLQPTAHLVKGRRLDNSPPALQLPAAAARPHRQPLAGYRRVGARFEAELARLEAGLEAGLDAGQGVGRETKLDVRREARLKEWRKARVVSKAGK
eukprot:6185253-Pleurochrysis_carterae.AAC.1